MTCICMCLAVLSSEKIMTENCEEMMNLMSTYYVLCQMKESIMNQEKLAKLQVQVRIGGKVSYSTCMQITLRERVIFFLNPFVGQCRLI